MKTVIIFSTPLVFWPFVLGMTAQNPGPKAGFAVWLLLTGTVRDNKGLPLAGAGIQLIREGANQLVETDQHGGGWKFFPPRFLLDVYSLKAMAPQAFGEVLSRQVSGQVLPAEIACIGSSRARSLGPDPGRSNVKDRDNVKWNFARRIQGRRSIFQAQRR